LARVTTTARVKDDGGERGSWECGQLHLERYLARILSVEELQDAVVGMVSRAMRLSA
jgi:hypothetical protein